MLSLKNLDNSLVDNSTMVDKDPTCFKEGRDGDHLLVPFQCDTCHFVNIQGRLSRELDKQDELLLLTIHRVSLDSLWERKPSTVSTNLDEGVGLTKTHAMLGTRWDGMPQRGPYRKLDDWGVHLACSMVVRLLDLGNSFNLLKKQMHRNFELVHQSQPILIHENTREKALLTAYPFKKIRLHHGFLNQIFTRIDLTRP